MSNLRRLAVGIAALGVAAACAPMAAPIPFATLQRGDRLPAGASAVTLAAGAGVTGVGWPEGGAGGVVQGRFAAGDGGEVSVAGQAIAHDCSGCTEEWQGTHVGFAGRVGYRTNLDGDSSLLVGAGYAGHAGGTSAGLDAGYVGNLGRYLYFAARLGVSEPVTQEAIFDDGAVTPTTTYALGALGVRSPGRSAFIAELGAGSIHAGDEWGGGFYLLVGADLLRLAP